MDRKQPLSAATVTVVGEINPDLILYGFPEDLPLEVEHLADQLSMTLGSSSAILAHNLSALGTKVRFFGAVGVDAFGDFCQELLLEAGVQLQVVPLSHSHAGTGLTVILPHGKERRILTYPGIMADLRFADLPLHELAKANHFHLSSLYLQRSLMPDVPQLFAEMQGRGLTTSLDTNDDPAGNWGSPFSEILPHLDILFCNQRELLKITGLATVDDAAQHLAEQAKLVVVKLGAEGAAAFTQNQASVRVTGHAVETVVDTVGAGDSFDAGFLHEFLAAAPLQDCLRFANAAGAFSVTQAGGVKAFGDRAKLADFFGTRF